MRGSTLYEEIDLLSQKLCAVARRPGRGPNAGVADARLEDRFLYLPSAPKDYAARAEELDDLFQAVADLRPLRCWYRRAKRAEETQITIHPYALLLYKDGIYCVGLNVEQNKVRTYLLDRMRNTECAPTERFVLPDGFNVDDYFQGQFGIFRGGHPRKVVVELEPRVAALVCTSRVHPSQNIVPLDHGRVRLTMLVGKLTAVSRWILGLGGGAKVVEPPELVAKIRRELTRALAIYGKVPGPNGSPEVDGDPL
jgi:predicted DNA-binding transcriptional regulator YafY